MTLVPPSSKYGNSAIVLGSGAAGWSHTGDTIEALLTSVAIPANTIGLGQLEVIAIWTTPNNGNTKTLGVRFGAANDLTGTAFLTAAQGAVVTTRTYTTIANRATNSQLGYPAGSTSPFSAGSGTAKVTAAIDTTAQTFVVFSALLGVNTDTITLESYLVRLAPAV